MKPGEIAEAWALIAQLGVALGVERINEIPGCWTHQIDELWHVAVNGHDEAQRFETAFVEPFHAYVRFNGWPAAIFSPVGGEFVVGRDCNESAFCEAVKAAIAKAKSADSAHVQSGLD